MSRVSCLELKARRTIHPHTCFCVGRLSQEKGQALLLEAVASLVSRSHELRLHIVGDGPDRRWLENYANQLGISAHIVFEGWVDPRAPHGTLLSERYFRSS